MSESNRVGALQLEQDLDYARKQSRVQRVGWIAMLLVVAAAVAGLFGDGPLASASARAPGLRVDYDRFARHGAESRLSAEIAPGARPSGTVRFWIDRRYLEGVDINAVTPEPERVEARGDALWYTFAATDSTAPVVIALTLRPDAHWSRRGSVGIENGSSVSFHQFVYP